MFKLSAPGSNRYSKKANLLEWINNWRTCWRRIVICKGRFEARIWYIKMWQLSVAIMTTNQFLKICKICELLNLQERSFLLIIRKNSRVAYRKQLIQASEDKVRGKLFYSAKDLIYQSWLYLDLYKCRKIKCTMGSSGKRLWKRFQCYKGRVKSTGGKDSLC